MSLVISDFVKEKFFDNHYKIITINNNGVEGFIAIHRYFDDFPSFGATRLWDYSDKHSALVDVLRLSHLMTYKSLAAGLSYGGAKAVLLPSEKLDNNRLEYFQSYAHEINKLNGLFITGSDVGISQNDVIEMKKVSPNIVGAFVDPSYYTALGIVACMEKICSLSGLESLENKRIGIDGVGKVGYEILKLLVKKNAIIYISDIDQNQVDKIKSEFPKINILPVNSMPAYQLDIYSPCALSNAINHSNIENIKSKFIIGAANNQLEDKQLADKLWESNIIYVPDYLVNAGGLISVVSEYENILDNNKIKEKVVNISSRLEMFLNEAKQHHKPLHRIVDNFVEKKLFENK